MTDVAALNALLEPEVESLGYRLVRVAMIGGTSDPTLQVMAEKPSTRQLDLSDCEVISRKLSDIFSNGHDWKAELRPALRDYVQKNLIVDRMLDGFRAADKFVAERSKARARA